MVHLNAGKDSPLLLSRLRNTAFNNFMGPNGLWTKGSPLVRLTDALFKVKGSDGLEHLI